MAPKGWTRPPQKEWLEERRPGAEDSRVRTRFGNWVQALCHDWFLKWPERLELFGNWEGPLTLEQSQELGEAIEERRKVSPMTLMMYREQR